MFWIKKSYFKLNRIFCILCTWLQRSFHWKGLETDLYWQRGLVYTENKPLGRLCKMRHPFFYEFRMSPSVNVFKFVAVLLMCTPRTQKARWLTRLAWASAYSRRRRVGWFVLWWKLARAGCTACLSRGSWELLIYVVLAVIALLAGSVL
jgi:hypothetical protein